MSTVAIRIRRDTLSNWQTANPVLREGEMSFVTDQFMIKFGDGVTAWNDLTCVIDIEELQTCIAQYTLNMETLQELVDYVNETTEGQLTQINDAIEAVNGIIGEKIGIDDVTASASTTYSSNKLEREFEQLRISGGYFKIVETVEDRDAIAEEDREIGMLCYVQDEGDTGTTYQLIGTTDNDGWEIFSSGGGGGGSSNVPELSYTSEYPEGQKVYVETGASLTLTCKFTSTTYGDCTIRVYRNNVLINTFTSVKGTIVVDLGELTTDGTFTYRIAGTDYLGVSAPDDLTYTVIVGGLKLSSTFNTILENTVIEETTSISVPYSVTCADTSQIVKLYCTIKGSDGTNYKAPEIINTGTYSINSTWFIGLLPRDTYTVSIQAYTGSNINDTSSGALVSSALTYTFNVLSDGEISILCELNDTGITSNTYLSIPYRVSGKNVSVLLMRGTLYSVSNYGEDDEELTVYKETSSSGVQSTVGVLSYWFVGQLPAGTYKYVMYSYTLDSQKQSVDAAEGYFTVEQASYSGVTPVQENLIAWFDANDMRNSVDNPDEWNNKVTTYPQYQIELHNLNFNTNGWKHVDESLSDSEDGEMMLKFTGDSYGVLVNKNTGDEICPLADFNNAAIGYAMEVVFRTRCVGEMNARVVTCQNGVNTSSAGFSVTHDNLYVASTSQSTNLGFAEDEWIHATFVIDRNIRTLSDVGLNSIENMNPVPTMRIYINGVLCSCTALTNDSFLDALGNAYPLYLNCGSYMNNPYYFGECEIKTIKLYNNYLTSEQVLQNYIASVYDLTEQAELQDKNDISTKKLPIITFKKKSSSVANFEILNSITDKKTSNKTCVDCTVEIQNTDGTIDVWENVEVFLQGTSSLQYPVKNYKLKLYEDAEKTTKMKVKMKDDWKKESTFTLKCDYMESSHLNNTPTANFYNDLITILGGNSPAKANGYKDAIDGFPVIVYYTDDETDSSKLTLVGSYMFNIDKKGKTLGFSIDEDVDGRTVDKPQSFEGTANSSDTAGCFYSLSESINNVYQYYIEDCYEEAYEQYLADNNLTINDISLDEFKETEEGQAVTYMTFEEFQVDYNEYDYVLEDFEARYDYTELEDIENPTEEDYENGLRPLINLVNGVSTAVNNGTFRDWMDEHFDLTYALAYYLQMMVFGQVDNAGKNSMWDTWDGEYWYVRPYDMDTQVGLSNTGTETIGVDAEMIPSLSPTSATGTFADYTTNSLTELRYASYNTKTSKFWNTFGTEYISEIKAAYQSLRRTVYDLDYIMEYYQARTTDLIGEIYYNKDMAAKYLTQTSASNTEYLKMLHGNRIQRFKQWMQQRLDFCDTLFDYRYSEDNTNSINGEISLRTDAYLLTGNSTEATDETSTLRAYIGILTYTPQYVTVSVGSGRDAIITAYCSQNSTYTDPDTKQTVKGTLFTFPIKATDKEMTISASGGIQLLNKLEDLNIRDLTIANATKILELDLQGSSRMTKLTMGNNKYLRELNCSGSIQLGTANGGQVLDLTGCPNIQNLDITNTKIATVNFSSGSNLKTATFAKSSITSLYFDSLEFLTDIDITDCEYITEYTINSCPAIEEVSLASSPIVVFRAINCENLDTVDVSNCSVLETFEITNCPNITTLLMRNNNGSMMNDLLLYTLYNLEYLDVANTASLENIRFPKYESEEEANRIAALRAEDPTLTDDECNAQLWHNLTTLLISSSSIKYIQYGSADVDDEDKVCDMSQLTNLSSITFNSCTSLEVVENLNYSAASVNRLFYQCTNLTRVQGTITATSNASELFRGCTVLTDIDDLDMNFAGVTTIASIFYNAGTGAGNATFAMLKKVLDACDESLTNISSVMYSCSVNTQMAIPSNLFENTPNITNASTAFVGTKVTSISSALFANLTKLQNAQYMFHACSSLTTVNKDIFKQCTDLRNTSYMFSGCTSLVNFIDSDCNIFENSPLITTTAYMFYNCSKLKNTNGLEGMLDPLTSLQVCSYMFFGCNAFTGSIPNGFFSENTALVTANGVFTGCTGITGLPARLFRKEASDTNSLSYLTSMRSLFYNCTALVGNVPTDFFSGAPNLRYIGVANSDNYPMSNSRIYLYGFFGKTKVEGFYEDFLAVIPNVLDVSYLFADDTNLKYCYYDNNGTDAEYNNSLSVEIFASNPLLQNASYAFKGCTALLGCIPYKEVGGAVVSLFEACKSNITDVSYMFSGCTNLSGTDLDNSVLSGFPSSLFTNAAKLQNVARFLDGNTQHVFEIPNGMFDGCSSLINTSGMFYNCRAAQGSIPVSLFNDCRGTLQNVSYMFYYCDGLTGSLPEGTYTYEDDTKVTVQKGFLADCLALTSAASLFTRCEKLTGRLPIDIFDTSSITDKYNNLTDISNIFNCCLGLNAAYEDEDLGVNYICNPNLFTKCVALTTVEGAFRGLKALPACEVPPTLFAKQSSLTNAQLLFDSVSKLTGTITATFMANCLGTLTNVYRMFAFTNITGVVTGFLHGTSTNKKLTTVGALFYRCNNITGTAPYLWDGSVFTKIDYSQTGYHGAFYGGSALTNYSDMDSNWTRQLDIYGI